MHAVRSIRHVHQVIQKTRKRRRKIAGDGGTNGSHGLRDKRNQVLSWRACIAIVQEQEPDVSRRSHNTWGTSLPSVSHASIVQFFSFSSRRFPFSFVTTRFHVGNCTWINGKRGIIISVMNGVGLFCCLLCDSHNVVWQFCYSWYTIVYSLFINL